MTPMKLHKNWDFNNVYCLRYSDWLCYWHGPVQYRAAGFYEFCQLKLEYQWLVNCIILRIFFIKAVSTCSHVKPACCHKWIWWGGTEIIQSTHSPNSMKTVMDKLCSSSCAIIWFYSFQYTFITRSSNSFSSKINDFLCRFWSLPSMVGKGNDNKHFNSLTDLYQTVKISKSNAAWLIWG